MRNRVLRRPVQRRAPTPLRYLMGVLAAVGASCSAGGGSQPQVGIRNYAFSPSPLVVHVGQVVRIVNHDTVLHGFAADDGSFNFGTLSSNGGTVRLPTTKTGTIAYHCTLHSAMHGVLIVEP